MKIIRRDLPTNIPPLTGLPDFLSRVYLARGVCSSEELELGLKQMLDNSQLKGLDQAIELLLSAFKERQRILIVGDFDADGATSTALAIDALRSMGAADCRYLVPNRFEYGYGLTPEIVDLAAQMQPQLIITVDNGISSVEGVKRCHELGIKVLVTDHHLPGDEVPEADAIVNPNQRGCPFPSKNAAGVGVVFYVMTALRAALRGQGWFAEMGIQEPNLASYLDLVALGTVADLVPLDKNNRILVEQGLQRIRAGRCRVGIASILACAQKRCADVVASDLGFIVGPRLNAAGRLDDMSLGIACLLEQDPIQAKHLAQQLDDLNRRRRAIEDEMKLDAEALLAEFDTSAHDSAWGLCLYEPHWHQGVIGILASRVKEKLHRPVVAFAPADDNPNDENPLLKGSARSIPGLHLRDALDLVAKRHPQILTKFGGHAMAAGMSIEYRHLAAFTEAFDQVVREKLDPSALEAVLLTDGPLAESDLSLDSVSLLNRSGPWGQQFPEPRFDDEFIVVQSRVLKDRHLKLVLSKPGSERLFDAIQFNSTWVSRSLPSKIRVVYRPSINEFRGSRSVQLMLDYIQA